MPLARNKIALVHFAKKQLDMDDDAYYAMLARVAGVESSRDLDSHGFNQVMAEFERLGFKSDFGQANLSNRAGMATPGQVAMIRDLWGSYTGQASTEAGLRKWLESHWKIGHLKFVTQGQAHRIIGALQSMVKKKGPLDGAPAA